MELRQKLILASGSPRRLDLLKQAGIEPARLMPMDLDETPKKSEHPRSLARRLSAEKARACYDQIRSDLQWNDSYIIAADTVVAVGRRILPKAEYLEEASSALHLLSGRSHWVFTGVCLITPEGITRQKVAETKVRFKRLSSHEIESYLASGQWRGKAGAYAIQGIAGCFPQKLVGSYTNVVGLPLFETMQMLSGEGFDVQTGWTEG
ncbi:Maf-like protein [Rhizobium sp. S95]|uniref:dTTP/UTP pyrophosphatase n=1 Tax=Ciceribacter sichuanensis TaxID=2949647 RepID=A0AAJ1BXP9_9HYPH|nr:MULTISPECIES: Maf-like protein [Rhizobiaceae]PZU80473.1 MAG: Maf-like protein [Shinella sp.]ATN32977.1 septum formation protein Maf [Rhizobium sp. ACO-34A]MCM2396740.1 Maf-like protein [Ciceribacter sp. S95]MCM2401116.1 Maf-like protein [Ciceribacter sp. S153]MCO5958168.1 Maf-like protein [Ciceribacter sp. S101]